MLLARQGPQAVLCHASCLQLRPQLGLPLLKPEPSEAIQRAHLLLQALHVLVVRVVPLCCLRWCSVGGWQLPRGAGVTPRSLPGIPAALRCCGRCWGICVASARSPA